MFRCAYWPVTTFDRLAGFVVGQRPIAEATAAGVTTVLDRRLLRVACDLAEEAKRARRRLRTSDKVAVLDLAVVRACGNVGDVEAVSPKLGDLDAEALGAKHRLLLAVVERNGKEIVDCLDADDARLGLGDGAMIDRRFTRAFAREAVAHYTASVADELARALTLRTGSDVVEQIRRELIDEGGHDVSLSI